MISFRPLVEFLMWLRITKPRRHWWLRRAVAKDHGDEKQNPHLWVTKNKCSLDGFMASCMHVYATLTSQP